MNNIYVHIIESLTPQNYDDELTTGRALRSFFDICKIPNISEIDYEYFSPYTKDDFYKSLNTINKVPVPILHICAHGFDDYSGISLTDKTKITWEELGSRLGDIRTQIRKNTNSNIPLGVVMSSCYGASGSSMASLLQYSQCFDWLIGSEGTIGIGDAALAFAVFYRILQKGLSVQEACTVASNIHPLRCFWGQDIRVNAGLDNFMQQNFS